MKILIVDDSSTTRKIMRNILVSLNYHDILEAQNGSEALQKVYENEDINVLITDWNMPEMDGLELVKKIRCESKYEDMLIIMVTTEGCKPKVIESLKAGVNNFIVKPFTPNTLKEKMIEIFKD